MFHQSALKIDHNSRNCGMTLSGRNILHNVCSHILAAAASSELDSSVNCGQVKSKDVLYSDD